MAAARKLIWNVTKWRPWVVRPGSPGRMDPDLLRGITDENGRLLTDNLNRILIGAF